MWSTASPACWRKSIRCAWTMSGRSCPPPAGSPTRSIGPTRSSPDGSRARPFSPRPRTRAARSRRAWKRPGRSSSTRSKSCGRRGNCWPTAPTQRRCWRGWTRRIAITPHGGTAPSNASPRCASGSWPMTSTRRSRRKTGMPCARFWKTTGNPIGGRSTTPVTACCRSGSTNRCSTTPATGSMQRRCSLRPTTTSPANCGTSCRMSCRVHGAALARALFKPAAPHGRTA